MDSYKEVPRAKGAIHRVVDVDYESAQWPNPTDLLTEAQRQPVKPRMLSATDYAPVVDTLRAKDWSWTEIHNWLVQHGLTLSQQAIISAWRNWCVRNFGSSGWDQNAKRWVETGLRPFES